MSHLRRDRLAVAAFVGAGVLWGLGFPFGKVAFAQLGPAQVVLLRFILATAVLLPIPLLRRRWPRRRDLPLFIFTGVLTVPVVFLFQYAGLTLTTAASASLIMGATTPILAVAAVAFCGERMEPLEWVAVLASTVGVALIVGQPSGDHHWLGDALVLLSAISCTPSLLLSKALVHRYDAITATTYIVAFGTIALAPAALLWEGIPPLDLSGSVWVSVLVLGLGCSALSTLLYNWGLGQSSASKASVFLQLEPLVGAFLGVTFLNESLSAGAVVGGALIIAAATFMSRPPRSSAQEQAAPLPAPSGHTGG
ncbi:MAG: DMT family transporter [Anaerolineae bacterium]|jgi:drug/metabolite transporter (DMT)-like permease